MEYSFVSEINPTRHNWCIKVRVSRMWTLSRTPKGKGITAMELALVDEEVLPLRPPDICCSVLLVTIIS